MKFGIGIEHINFYSLVVICTTKFNI